MDTDENPKSERNPRSTPRGEGIGRRGADRGTRGACAPRFRNPQPATSAARDPHPHPPARISDISDISDKPIKTGLS
jgi:hypothetical protein